MTEQLTVTRLCAAHRGPHAVAATVGHLCTGCRDRLTTDIHDLALVTIADLWTTSTRIGERPGGIEPQPPARLNVIDTKIAATTAALGTANRIACERHLQPATTLTAALQLLRIHLGYACDQPWIGAAARRINRAAAALRHLVTGEHPNPVATCQVWDRDTDTECGGPLLPSAGGAVRCARCGDTWTPDDLDRLGRQNGADMPLRTKMQRLGRMTTITREADRLERHKLQRMKTDHDTAWADARDEWTVIWDAARSLAWEAGREDEWERFQGIDFNPVYDACVVVAAGDLIDDRTHWTEATRDRFAAPFTNHTLLQLLD